MTRLRRKAMYLGRFDAADACAQICGAVGTTLAVYDNGDIRPSLPFLFFDQH
jgi:hypothetical protein